MTFVERLKGETTQKRKLGNIELIGPENTNRAYERVVTGHVLPLRHRSEQL